MSSKPSTSLRVDVSVLKSSGKTKRRTARRAVGAGGITFDDVREVAHNLPGVEDGTSYGTAALKVGECFVLRTTILDRQIMMQADPEAFFLTDHYLGYPWILVRFTAVRKSDLPELLDRAWSLVVPKSLLAKTNEGSLMKQGLKDGARCTVIGGTHKGKSGIVTDIKTSKTGHITITVVQGNGDRFKTLAKNVRI